MSIVESALQNIDATHAAVVRGRWAQRFTAMTRLLLAIAFAPSGYTKAVGEPFTQLTNTDPVGAYFGMLHATGGYYNFLGLGQLLAAALLLHPRTASLGAAIYLPIILNIFVLTISVPFGGTPLITGLMLLACVYLLCWDLPLWRRLLSLRREGAKASVREYVWLPLVFGSLGLVGFSLLAALRVGNLDRTGIAGGLAITGAGFLFGVACAWHVRQGVWRVDTAGGSSDSRSG